MGTVPERGPVPVLVAVAVVCLLLLPPVGHATAQEEAQPDVKLVTVDPDSPDRLWPYTSRERRFETLTLPINVVVLGNDTRIRWFLQTGQNVNWNESEGEWEGIGGESASESSYDWYDAHGATRYTYIHSSKDPYGGWVDESYQLHDGAYFGTRHHIRAYTGGRVNTSWTAMQVHHEYWDWFRLRHTVSSTTNARRYVEQSFYGTTAVERVGRERYANGGIADADGWVTVAVMRSPQPPEPGEPEPASEPGTGTGIAPGPQNGTGAETRDGDRAGAVTGPRSGTGSTVPTPLMWSLSAALLSGALVSFDTIDVRRGVVSIQRRFAEVDAPASLAALVAVSLLTLPSLRWASITAEQTLPWLSPKVIAGLGYLLLAVALPTTVAVLAREMRAARAVPLATVGLGTGIFLDYALVGITLIPVSVVLHRLAVVLTVGLFAAAGARLGTDRPGGATLPVATILLWMGVLVWPILDPLLDLLL